MRWLTALLAVLVPAATLAGVGQNRATPRGPVFGNPNFPYFGGAGAAGSTNNSNFWIPPYLANPVWKGAADAQVMVTGVPNETARFRVKWGTSSSSLSNTVAACWQDRTTIAQATENPCNIPANARFDFLLSGMAEDTKIFYQVERSTDGGTTWSQYPMAYFTTLASAAATTQHFLYISDEHLTGVYGNTVCGTNDPTGNWARMQQTFANIQTNNATHNYRFYLTTGDNALTHISDDNFDPCMNVMGKSPHRDNLCTLCGGAATTQNEADARWIIYLREIQPVTKYAPLVVTLGNHEGETQYAQQVGDLATMGQTVPPALSISDNAYWYFDANNNLDVYSRTARLKYMPNPDFTYTGTSGAGSANGNYFSLASGSFEMIVTDIERGPGTDLDGDATLREFPSDFPGACPTASPGSQGSYVECSAAFPLRGPNDWFFDSAQCTFLTNNGTCTGVAGRIQGTGAPATTWTAGANSITGIKWKFLSSHHSAGSNMGLVAGKLYGRGGMGNVARVCTTAATVPVARRGGACSVNSDCNPSPPSTLACCDPGESGAACLGDASLATRNQGNLSGTMQQALQTAEKAWAAGGGRKFFNLYGHDHLSTCAQKHDGGGATGVYYCEGTQPGGNVEGPAWMDNIHTVATYDWGGLDNQPDGVPDYCNDSTVNGAIPDGGNLEVAACGGSISTNSFGTTVRGYIDVEIVGTTEVIFRQRSSVVPQDLNLLGVPLTNNSIEWTMDTVP